MVVQTINTADIHVSPSKRALDFSVSSQGQDNVFSKTFSITSTKSDLFESLLLERNMGTGSTLSPLYFE